MTDRGDQPGILVIDDNPQNRDLIEATLESEDYRVVLAASGAEGLAAFEATPFDVVLLDVRMPEIDGFEVCRRLRVHPRGAETSIVFLTALRDVDTFDAARSAGGDDFLTKPLRPTELLVRVAAALELRRLSAENRGYFATVREQRDAVMRLQLQKEQLTAFLVHDLKNPVNALDMHAQLLLRDRSLSDRGKESARAIRQEARRLIQLITNMLDINKAEAGELTARMSDVDLAALAKSVLADFEMRAHEQRVGLVNEVETIGVPGDPDLLRRVLENLIDNALRHAPRDTVVTVRAAERGDATELCIADQGAGVPERLRTCIFDRFVQGERDAGSTGYGLGLAFCKLAVVAHGGTIEVADGAPGAVFRIRLPLRRSES